MAAFIARAVLWLIFGFVLTDIFNEFKVFDAPLPLYAVLGPVMLFFALQEIFLKRLEIKRKSSKGVEFFETKTFKIFYILVWIFAICLLLGIPILWWGVIKKFITAGGG
jgi:hypothetical protein